MNDYLCAALWGLAGVLVTVVVGLVCIAIMDSKDKNKW